MLTGLEESTSGGAGGEREDFIDKVSGWCGSHTMFSCDWVSSVANDTLYVQVYLKACSVPHVSEWLLLKKTLARGAHRDGFIWI
jgi:hypothetical protein